MNRLNKDWVDEHRALIAVAEACHKNGSQSWHVFDWMAYKLRCKYPLVPIRDRMVRFDNRIS